MVILSRTTLKILGRKENIIMKTEYKIGKKHLNPGKLPVPPNTRVKLYFDNESDLIIDDPEDYRWKNH